MNYQNMVRKTLVAASFSVAGLAQATVTTSTLPEFNGNGAFPALEFVGTFVYSLPFSELITSAVLSGTFGNSMSPNSAQSVLIGDGIPVASCLVGDPCWNSGTPTPWSYSFLPGNFNLVSDGSVSLFAAQTGCCVNRLGDLKFEITTAPVPEPGGYAMMLAGLGALGFMARRRRSDKS